MRSWQSLVVYSRKTTSLPSIRTKNAIGHDELHTIISPGCDPRVAWNSFCGMSNSARSQRIDPGIDRVINDLNRCGECDSSAHADQASKQRPRRMAHIM